MSEIGVIAAQGTCNMRSLGALILEGDGSIPQAVRALCGMRTAWFSTLRTFTKRSPGRESVSWIAALMKPDRPELVEGSSGA
ncbi:MAG: hypothetical protein C0515_05130 [Novosphingobium sp.]|nr:hypothetical protein [Novosphingobium sp.]MBX9642719.1 hypothetical protein [Novosphingobium sp.]